MRKGMLMMIAVAGLAIAGYAMTLKAAPAQAECCGGDPICWPCPPAAGATVARLGNGRASAIAV